MATTRKKTNIEQIVALAVAQAVKETVPPAIRGIVNGKIDKMNARLDDAIIRREEDMARVLPIIEAFEGSERAIAIAGKTGKGALWVASFIVAIGSAILIVRKFLES